MTLTSSISHPASTSTLQRCPSCDTPAPAFSSYCGFCGCDLSPQNEFAWHEERPALWSFGSLGWEAG